MEGLASRKEERKRWGGWAEGEGVRGRGVWGKREGAGTKVVGCNHYATIISHRHNGRSGDNG